MLELWTECHDIFYILGNKDIQYEQLSSLYENGDILLFLGTLYHIINSYYFDIHIERIYVYELAK